MGRQQQSQTSVPGAVKPPYQAVIGIRFVRPTLEDSRMEVVVMTHAGTAVVDSVRAENRSFTASEVEALMATLHDSIMSRLETTSGVQLTLR